MIRTWKLLVLSASLAVLLALAPAVVLAQAEGKNAAVDKSKQADKVLERIGKEMVDAKAAMLLARNHLQAAQDKIEQLEKEIAEVKNDLSQMRLERPPGTSATQAFYPPEQANIDAIARRLAKIEQDLARLTPPPRVSLYPAAAVGRLRLVNDYPEEMLFVINSRSYRVAPGMTQVIDQVPAGAFTYEVVSPTWGLRASRSPTLAAGETFTLTAH
jgi:hypothetical protein